MLRRLWKRFDRFTYTTAWAWISGIFVFVVYLTLMALLALDGAMMSAGTTGQR